MEQKSEGVYYTKKAISLVGRIIILLFVFLLSCDSYAQDYKGKDGVFIVYMTENDAVDQKLEILPGRGDINYINGIIANDRYIVTIIPVKFGTLVVHQKNINNEKQLVKMIDRYLNLKKECDKMNNDGYVLDKYSLQDDYSWNNPDYAIFKKSDINPKYSMISFKKETEENKKKLEQLSKKGIFVEKLMNAYHGFLMIKTNTLVEQKYERFSGKNDGTLELIESFNHYSADHWTIGDIYKKHWQSGNDYQIVYNKSRTPYVGKQKIGAFEDKDELVDFLQSSMNEGLKICNIWGGYDRNLEKEAYWQNRIEEYRANKGSGWSEVIDIIQGITNSAIQLTNGNNSSLNSYTGQDTPTEGKKSPSKVNSSSETSTKVNHTNWKSLDNAYNGYESQLIKMSTSGVINKSEVRSIQNKMKEIRDKIYQQSGHQRAVSQWENWKPDEGR